MAALPWARAFFRIVARGSLKGTKNLYAPPFLGAIL
jgi:hypothetical protein